MILSPDQRGMRNSGTRTARRGELTFDDDAKIVSSVCNIVLTGRDMGTGNRVPLARVPYHAIDSYLARLIQAGYKVAIVEQTSDESAQSPATKSLMEREVALSASPQSHRTDSRRDERPPGLIPGDSLVLYGFGRSSPSLFDIAQAHYTENAGPPRRVAESGRDRY